MPGGRTLAALNELKRRVKVKRAERTFVVEVDVTSRDPDKAVRIANAIAQAYLDEQTQVRADAARQVSQSLSARLKELKDSVRDADEKVEAFKASNDLLAANGQLVNEQQLSEINNQLSAARARTAEAKARLDQVEAVQRSKDEIGAFPEALQSPTITALRSQYAEVMRREAEQTATLGALHPAVIDIQAQAERLRRMIDDEVDRTAVAARTEYESAKASEQTLADNLDSAQANRGHQQRSDGRACASSSATRRRAATIYRGVPGPRARDRRAGAARHQEYPHALQGRPAATAQLAAAEPAHGAGRDDARRRRRHRHRADAAASTQAGAADAAASASRCARPFGRHRIVGRPPRPRRSGAGGIAGRRRLVRPERGRRSGFAVRAGNAQSLRRGAARATPQPAIRAFSSSPPTTRTTPQPSRSRLPRSAAATQRVLLIDADLRTPHAVGDRRRRSEAGLVDVAVGRRLLPT